MSNVGKGEIGDPHGVEGIIGPQQENGNSEETLGGSGPSDDNEGEGDATSDSENNNENPVQPDPN